MTAIGSGELLDAWDLAQSHSPAERGAALLTVLCPDAPVEGWDQAPIGQRDARLLELWQRAFGPELPCVTPCAQCGEWLELSLSVPQLQLPPPSAETPPTLQADGYQLTFRLPNTTDLVAAAAEPDVPRARRRILRRCLLRAVTARGEDVAADDLPEPLTAQVAGRLGEADPQADIAFDLACPQCGHRWQATFDIAAHFSTQLHAWAQRILTEVHQLATAYGWSEGEILRLSPVRRRAYVELIGS